MEQAEASDWARLAMNVAAWLVGLWLIASSASDPEAVKVGWTLLGIATGQWLSAPRFSRRTRAADATDPSATSEEGEER